MHVYFFKRYGRTAVQQPFGANCESIVSSISFTAMAIGKPPGRPRKPIETLDVKGISAIWDDVDEIRSRLRDEQRLMATDPSQGESIQACSKDHALLLPLLARMSLLETRPLPPIDPLRDEVEMIFNRNKMGSSADLGADVVKIAWHLRKLLGFIKMKTRRHEVSVATLSNCYDIFSCAKFV